MTTIVPPRPTLRVQERRVLEALAQSSQGLIPSALVHRTWLTRTEVGYYVDRLVVRGLAQRGRKTQPVVITEAGVEALS
jgi:DNA-binding MarR family transcriptional regulator